MKNARDEQHSSIAQDNLSPLDKIRQEEALAAAQVYLARQEAEGIISSARERASAMQQEAEEAGRQSAVAEREKLLSAARAEAEKIEMAALANTKTLTQTANLQVEAAAGRVIRWLLGIDSEDLTP